MLALPERREVREPIIHLPSVRQRQLFDAVGQRRQCAHLEVDVAQFHHSEARKHLSSAGVEKRGRPAGPVQRRVSHGQQLEGVWNGKVYDDVGQVEMAQVRRLTDVAAVSRKWNLGWSSTRPLQSRRIPVQRMITIVKHC